MQQTRHGQNGASLLILVFYRHRDTPTRCPDNEGTESVGSVRMIATAAAPCGRFGAVAAQSTTLTGYGDSLRAAAQRKVTRQLGTDDALRMLHRLRPRGAKEQRIMTARG